MIQMAGLLAEIPSTGTSLAPPVGGSPPQADTILMLGCCSSHQGTMVSTVENTELLGVLRRQF